MANAKLSWLSNLPLRNAARRKAVLLSYMSWPRIIPATGGGLHGRDRDQVTKGNVTLGLIIDLWVRSLRTNLRRNRIELLSKLSAEDNSSRTTLSQTNIGHIRNVARQPAQAHREFNEALKTFKSVASSREVTRKAPSTGFLTSRGGRDLPNSGRIQRKLEDTAARA